MSHRSDTPDIFPRQGGHELPLQLEPIRGEIAIGRAEGAIE